MTEHAPQPANQPALGCLLRFFWMAIGNVVLLIVGVQRIQSDQYLSGFDIAFWLIVLLAVGSSWSRLGSAAL